MFKNNLQNSSRMMKRLHWVYYHNIADLTEALGVTYIAME